MRSVTVNTWRTRPGPSLPAPISFPLSAPDKPGCLPLKRQACPQLRASGYPWTPAGHVLLDPGQRSVQTAPRGAPATAASTPRALVFLQGTHGRDRERVRPACFSSSAAASGPRSPGRQGRHPIGRKNTRRLKWTARLVTDGQKGSLCVAGGRGACSSAMGPTCPSALLHPGPGHIVAAPPPSSTCSVTKQRQRARQLRVSTLKHALTGSTGAPAYQAVSPYVPS